MPDNENWTESQAEESRDTRRDPTPNERYRLLHDIGLDGRNISDEERSRLMREVKWPPPRSGTSTVRRETAPRRATQRRPGTLTVTLARWDGVGIGTLLGGIAAIIAAVIIHDHAAYPNALCSSGLGTVGQLFSSTARSDCNMATTAEQLVGWLVFLGIVSAVIGSGKIILGIAASVPAQKLTTPGLPTAADSGVRTSGTGPVRAAGEPASRGGSGHGES